MFVDQDLRGGVEFRRVLEAEIARCEAFLAVIGPEWLASGDKVLGVLESNAITAVLRQVRL